MKERVVRPEIKSFNLSTGRRPHVVQALEIRHPHVGMTIRELERDGITLLFQRSRRVPERVRKLIHDEGTTVTLLENALKPYAGPEDLRTTEIRNFIDESLGFTTGDMISEVNLDKIDSLNDALQSRRVKHARRQLLYSRPKGELGKVYITGALTFIAAGLSTWLEVIGLKGPGLFAAQSLDDVGNTAITAFTEGGGKKGIKQIFKEKWPVIPVLALAAAGDLTIIPPMLESPSLPVRLAGGILFSAAAVGGSVSANILNIVDTARKRAYRYWNETKPQLAANSVKENISHPFRKWLWIGTALSAVSAVAAELAAARGLLIGKPYSGSLQTLIGQLETITAFGGLMFGKAASSVTEHSKDLWTIGKSKMKQKLSKSHLNK